MRGILARVLALYLCLLGSAYADAGINWLTTQSQSDGSIARSTDIATSFQSTAESVRTLSAAGITGSTQVTAAQQYLGSQTYFNTENLSRLIISGTAAGQDVSSAVSALLANQDSSTGGFGELPGYQPSILDTAFALEALAVSGRINSSAVAYGIGFLQQQQAADGSWADGANPSSVYLTALAMRSIWLTRRLYTVTNNVQRASTWLLGQADGNGRWAEPFLSAEALIAVVPTLIDRSSIQIHIQALQALQLTDGSFGDDVYTTALALRALQSASLPAPDQISLRGRVIDGQTGSALNGVAVSLNGAQSYSVATAADGSFIFSNIGAGNYTVQISNPGFTTVTSSTQAVVGLSVDLGTISLVPAGTGPSSSSTATISGKVTDAATGNPIPGATVAAGTLSTITATDGSYEIAGAAPGATSLSAGASGYQTATGSTTLAAGTIAIFSPKLSGGATQGNGTATLSGTVTDASTGQAISGATISVAGSSTATIQTDTGGNYSINGLMPGNLQITASASGHDSVSAGTQALGNAAITFSPKLYGNGTSPVNANTAGIAGTVVDSVTNQRLANVAITLTNPDSTTQSVVTAADGSFQVAGLSQSPVALTFALKAYVSSAFSEPLTPLQVTNIGQVRLRPQSATSLLPDLSIASIDAKTAAHTDPQTLQLSGTVQVSVNNIGTATTSNGFDVLAFYDVNRDGVIESGTDTVLGTAHVTQQIPINQSIPVQIPVSGILPFRDAPISILVDSANTVIEVSKTNNLDASGSYCVAKAHTTGGFSPVLKWAWAGGTIAPLYDQVMMAPLVARVHDDNGDGKIDQLDAPDLIFVSYRGNDGDFANTGIIRIVNGKTGADLAASSTQYSIPSYANLAIGDLNGDSKLEIVSPKAGGGLYAFAQDGTLLWSTTWLGALAWDFGAPAIVDLFGDGHPEIIFGGHVVSGSGQLLWSTSNGYIGGSHPYGSGGIAVDLNNDGHMAVLFGASAFSASGQLLWQNSTVGDGIAAVGRFNSADQYPEIVIVGSGRVSLLDHTGKLIWGPVPLPGGGRGGAPIVADLDGDGIPEIGVAGSNNYTVFNSDGSVKWSNVTQDYSSACTSSTVFDFYNDGKREVVYSDERHLHVYNGENGTPLLNSNPSPGQDGLVNSNGTAYDLPVIADIDGDNHAELVVISNYYYGNYAGATTGVRVFKDADNAWANTRQIWNQLSYHIDNVNDDGSIPRHESPSWSTHNSYRLNTFLKQNPFGLPDLTAGLLHIQDNGPGNPLTLSARIGNGGQITSPATTAAFYAGDPSNSGTLLGTVAVSALDPSTYQDVQLTGVGGPSGSQLIYVVVDPQNQVSECDKSNNVDNVPFSATTPSGAITVSTDAPSYGPNATINAAGVSMNQGSLTADFKIDLRIEDSAGNLVADLGTADLGLVAGGASVQTSATWNTVTTLAGSYVLHGLLLRTDGSVAAQAITSFAIVVGSGAGAGGGTGSVATASLRVTTDKQIYNTTDRVTIGDLVRNLTVNGVIDNASLQLQVVNPSGVTVYSQTHALGQMTPGFLRQLFDPYAFAASAQGAYTVNGWVLNGSGNVIASSSATYSIVENLTSTINGTETVQSPWVYQGDTQTCTDVVTNNGTQNVSNLSIHQVLVNLDTGVLDQEAFVTANLAPGASKTFTRVFTTNGLPLGHHACAIEAQVNGSYKPLANALFEVRQPPVRVTGNFGLGDKGRLLVLMDGPTDTGSGGSLCNSGLGDVSFEIDFDHGLSPEAIVEVKVLNFLGLIVDTETTSLRSFTGEVNAKTGTGGVDLSIPEFTTDSLVFQLAGNGASHLLAGTYRVVATVTDPVQNLTFNSGLISLTCNLLGTVGDVVGGVFKIIGVNTNAHPGIGPGDGADSIPAAQQKTALKALLAQDGWSYDISTTSADFATKLRTGGYQNFALLSEYQVLDEQVQKEVRENVFGGDGLLNAGRHDVRRRILDNPLGIEYRGTQLSPTGGQMLAGNAYNLNGQAAFTQNNQVQRVVLEGASVDGNVISGIPTAQQALVTHYHYGNGLSVSTGFDLLAEASAGNQTGLFANLIRQPLIYVNPSQSTPVAGRVVPTRLSVTNTGIANTTAATISTSLGSYVTAANAGTVSGGKLTWTFSLAANETKTVDLWIQLPPGGIPVTLTAKLVASSGNFTANPVMVTYAVNPVTRPALDQAITDLTTYVNNQPPPGLLGWLLDPILGIKTPAAQALIDLKAANQDLSNGNVQRALAELIQATDYLINDGSTALKPIRLKIDEAIFQTQKLQ